MARIISRAEWGARPPRYRVGISIPTSLVFLHHTAGNEREAAGMRSIQNFHMDVRGWSDGAYSFVIDRVSGNIYMLRGPGIAGGHTRGYNRTSHAICVMGNFNNYAPSRAALSSIVALLVLGNRSGWWALNMRGHRDVASTACPGNQLYPSIPSLVSQARSGSAPTPPSSGGFLMSLTASQQRTVFNVANSFNGRVSLLNIAALRDHLPKVLDEIYNFNGRITLLTIAAIRSEVPKAVKQALKEG